MVLRIQHISLIAAQFRKHPGHKTQQIKKKKTLRNKPHYSFSFFGFYVTGVKILQQSKHFMIKSTKYYVLNVFIGGRKIDL